MKQIPLTQEKVAIVDDDMYEYLSQWKWHYVNGYAVRSETCAPGKQKAVFMHRLIMQAPDGMEVDHKETEDTLNNQRSNLRLCTHSQNNHNRTKYSNNTSGYKGVFPLPSKRWRACIKNQGERLHIGVFDTPEEAARAYDAKARELFGEFANTNFK
jgi:hypothetical protein